MVAIEVVQRSPKQHRQGQYSIHIDGNDAEYTNDPAQHFQKMLAKCLAEGLSPAQATEKAAHLADETAKYVLNRVASRIARGRLFPGGMPANENFLAPHLLPKEAALQGSTADSAYRFINRGRLYGLSEAARVKRVENRDKTIDHQAQWRKNRETLLAARSKKLEELERELATCSSEFKGKLERAVISLRNEVAGLKVGIVNASHGFQYAFGQYLQAGVNFVSGDIRLVPCMTNTTVDTERDAKDMVSDFTTLDEADGSGYSSGGAALDNQAVNIDDANDRAECDADDETISSFGACTRSIQGLLVIKFDTNLNNSVPLHWLEFSSNKTPDGSDFVLQINAEGYIQAA